METSPIVLADTITVLPPGVAGAVVVSGSHGGLYPGFLAASAGLRAVISSDAGIGLDEAGVASLASLESLGVAAAAVAHASARIGDAADMTARGVVSRANALARACGVEPGMSCAAAARLLAERAPTPPGLPPPPVGEGRAEAAVPGAARRLLLVDSAASVGPGDAGAVIATGSHGGLIGGVPAKALKAQAFAAAFNDAGIGADEAGVTRLPALDARGIAAVTVAAASARIGDARSTFADGIVSRANEAARRLGAAPGMRARELLERWTRLAG